MNLLAWLNLWQLYPADLEKGRGCGSVSGAQGQ